MRGWGEDKDSKSEAEIQRYKLLLFFLIPCLLYFFLSHCCGFLLWDGNCCSDCPPWESRKIQFHRYTQRIERWGGKKNLYWKKKSRYRGKKNIKKPEKPKERVERCGSGQRQHEKNLTAGEEKKERASWLLNMRLFYRRAGIEWKCDKYKDIVFGCCL